jgi:hypothetical protein
VVPDAADHDCALRRAFDQLEGAMDCWRAQAKLAS